MAVILFLVRQCPAPFLNPVEPDPVTLSCPLQPLVSVPHLPLKARLARAEPVSLPRGDGRGRLLAGGSCPSTFQNILGHRSLLYCEAALKKIRDLLNAVGNVLRPECAISAPASLLCCLSLFFQGPV